MFFTESFNFQLDDLLERLCIKLQITSTQHQLAEGHYKAIAGWLEADESPLAAARPDIYPQGSLRIGTTVRPVGRQEYDLDLVCQFLLDWQRITNPVVLLDVVENRLRQHDAYKTMIERKNRCIRVKYANEFHLDILPACPDLTSGNGCVMVPDREAKEWKASNPKGYAAWFESQTRLLKAVVLERVEPLPAQEPLEVKTPLKLVVQLMKRWRDIAYTEKPDLAPISIVLTTLAGLHYGGQQSVNQALSRVLEGIVNGLPNGGGRLLVINPTNPKEDLSERWDEIPGAYQAFVTGMISFQKTWQAINQQSGVPAIASMLGGLFGEQLSKSVVSEQAQAIEKVRRDKKLAVQRTSGVLTVTGTTSSRPVRPNTFHGS